MVEEQASRSIALRHFRFGWWSLLVYLSLGIILEAMHGLKIDWYLNETLEIRRLMWTLAHAHGTLISLIQLAFGATLHFVTITGMGKIRAASGFFLAAGIIMPMGFFLGGVFIYGGDPGLGVFLVPVGALALMVAVLLTGLSVTFQASSNEEVAGQTESKTESKKSSKASSKRR